jgi:hemerythrin superfamily protein
LIRTIGPAQNRAAAPALDGDRVIDAVLGQSWRANAAVCDVRLARRARGGRVAEDARYPGCGCQEVARTRGALRLLSSAAVSTFAWGGDPMDRSAKTQRSLARGRGHRRTTASFHSAGTALSKGRAMSAADDLDALDLLRGQHRALDLLFRAIQSAEGASKAASFGELADMLAVHATIEEWIFYPGVRSAETEKLLAASTGEHLAIQRTLADMLDEDVSGEAFDVKLGLLREQVRHHAIEEEEAKLFPKVRAATDDDYRAAMAGAMIALMVELQQKVAPAGHVTASSRAAPTAIAERTWMHSSRHRGARSRRGVTSGRRRAPSRRSRIAVEKAAK